MERNHVNLDNKSIYTLGAICALFAIIMIITDVVIGMATGGNLSALPQTGADRFLQFNNNSLVGLYNLDLLNVIIQMILIPVWFALFLAQTNTYRNWALLGLIIFLFGSAVMVSDNAAFPMYELSKKYAMADNEIQKSLYAAAGEAMLARGVHGSTAMFFSFLIPNIAGFIISLVMLRAGVFPRVNAWFGIVGYILMMIYVILVTFVPGVAKSATAFAMPGGILLLGWLTMITINLLKFSRY